MKAKKKPIIVHCLVWDGSLRPMYDFLTQTENMPILYSGHHFYIQKATVPNKPDCLFIRTLEGDMKADFNDVIIRGVNGEYYPCKPDIFNKTYEIVEF